MSGINQNYGVVSEAAQLRELVGKLTENNSTLVTEKTAFQVLLENEKEKSYSLRYSNSVLCALFDV